MSDITTKWGKSMPNDDTWLSWATHPKCRLIKGPPYFLNSNMLSICSQISRFMWPKWGPPGAGRTRVGLMLAPWTLLSMSAVGKCANMYPSHQLPNDLTVHTLNMVVWCKTCCISLLELCFIPVSVSRLTAIKRGLLKQFICNMLQYCFKGLSNKRDEINS